MAKASEASAHAPSETPTGGDAGVGAGAAVATTDGDSGVAVADASEDESLSSTSSSSSSSEDDDKMSTGGDDAKQLAEWTAEAEWLESRVVCDSAWLVIPEDEETEVVHDAVLYHGMHSLYHLPSARASSDY